MNRRSMHAALLAVLAALLGAPQGAVAADTADQAAIRQVMMQTWDQPQSRLQAGPIVVVDGRAVAGWTQGARGGRAVLARNDHGQWKVTVCGGDGIKDAKTLELTGMPPPAARQLASQLAKAEAAVPPQRLALFSTFDGMVRMDAAGNHPPHAEKGKH